MSVLDRFRLDGRTAILTGVGPGVGEHVAKAYAELGANVVISARSQDRLDRIAAEINARATITAGFTAERLIDGSADIAVQQLSELKQVAGAELVGPLVERGAGAAGAVAGHVRATGLRCDDRAAGVGGGA